MAVSRLDSLALLVGATATVNGAAIPIPINGLVSLYVTGNTFGGGTVQFQVSPDGGVTWFNCGTAFSSNSTQTVQVCATAIRALVLAATGAVINAWAVLPDYN